MAYTPINWQTGGTITADKLNRCDNGWGVENTQLFSETVTTEDDGDGNYAALAYDGNIDADTITVTFDGTEYVCPRIDAFGQYFYGGFNQGPDFTTYPFFIASGGGNDVYTETAGEHTIAAAVSVIESGTDFSAAVNSVADIPVFPLVIGTTTWQEAYDAMAAGRMAYTYDPLSNRLYLAVFTTSNTATSSYTITCMTIYSSSSFSTAVLSAQSPTDPLTS